MRPIKIQFIGFAPTDLPEEKEDEKFRLRRILKSEAEKRSYPPAKWTYFYWEDLSILDSNVVFLNNIDILRADWSVDAHGRKLEFPPKDVGSDLNSFLEGGQVLCAFLGQSNYHLFDGSTYPMLLISFRRGEHVIPNPNHWLKEILGNREYNFRWSSTINEGLRLLLKEMQIQLGKKPFKEKIYEVAGTTPANQCVSCVVHWEKGKIVLLPTPVKVTPKLLRHLLDLIKKNYFEPAKKEAAVTAPPWLDKYLVGDQPKLLEETRHLRGELGSRLEAWSAWEEDKEILWRGGKDLVRAVKRIFDKMGIEATMMEEEGLHDLEVVYEDFFGICEIKGIEGYANVDDVRQLLDHHIEALKINPNAKGIFIVNHFKSKDLSERDVGYSPDAIRLGTNNKFCLMTTWDLFNIYNDFLKGGKIKDIINYLSKTEGILKYP